MNEPKRINLPVFKYITKFGKYTIPLVLPGIGFFYGNIYIQGRANYYQIDYSLLSVQPGDVLAGVIGAILAGLTLFLMYLSVASLLFISDSKGLQIIIKVIEVASGSILILVSVPLVMYFGENVERGGSYSVVTFQDRKYRLVENQGNTMLVIPLDKHNKQLPNLTTYLPKNHDITVKYYPK